MASFFSRGASQFGVEFIWKLRDKFGYRGELKTFLFKLSISQHTKLDSFYFTYVQI